MTKERRLGRGLEALLGRIPVETGAVGVADRPTASGGMNGEGIARLDASHAGPTLASLAGDALRPAVAAGTTSRPQPSGQEPIAAGIGDREDRVEIKLIDSNPYNPREDFDPVELGALVESLKAHGLLQPLVVRRMGARYQLIAGERRLRAAAKAGWTNVPVHTIEADDRRVAELAIVENLQRKDLNALEKAACFQRYLDEYRCTQEELAARLKLDRSTVANLIRLLELPEAVQTVLRSGKITQGHARALLPLGDEQEQVTFCRRIQAEELSVRQTEALVQDAIQQADGPNTGSGTPTAKEPKRRRSTGQLAALEQEFRRALGLKVSIRQTNSGRGKVVINFQSHEEFEQLRGHICG